jgi:hypothetical protein
MLLRRDVVSLFRIVTNICILANRGELNAHTTECSRRMLNQFPIPDPSAYLSRRLCVEATGLAFSPSLGILPWRSENYQP